MPVLRLCYRMLTGIHVRRPQRVAEHVTTRTVSEVEYYHRESTQLAQSLVENQARIEGIYKYFSLFDYFYWQLE